MKSALLQASLAAVCSFGLTVSAAAQSLPVDSAALIDRGSVDLLADLEDSTHRDTDSADTALVFTNKGYTRGGVWCTAYDSDGDVVGRADTSVPGNGLRYLRASDLAGRVNFVGQASCWARGRVDGSAVFLAPSAVTSLKVVQHTRGRSTRIRFPVIASY